MLCLKCCIKRKKKLKKKFIWFTKFAINCSWSIALLIFESAVMESKLLIYILIEIFFTIKDDAENIYSDSIMIGDNIKECC